MITQKQEMFIRGLLEGKSQREAYRNAFPSSLNWKDTCVDNQASKLYRKPHIMARYNQLLAESVENTEEIRKLIIETEMAIVKANIGDIFDIEPTADNSGIVSVPKGDLSKFDMRAVKSYKYDKNGRLMLELYDKQPAIASLRELLAIKEKVDEDANKIEFELGEADAYGN